jgi:hypothetical protein
MTEPSRGRTIAPAAVAFAVLVGVCGAAHAWEPREHQVVADSCLAIVIRECGAAMSVEEVAPATSARVAAFAKAARTLRIEEGRDAVTGFGAISAWSASDDGERSRYHVRGRTVLEQLGALDAAKLGAILERHLPPSTAQGRAPAAWSAVRAIDIDDANVVTGFLAHHLVALHYAAFAAQHAPAEEEALSRALFYEAVALGFLSDAFSSAHILLQGPNLFSPLHRRNTADAHDFYRNHGAYVIDSRGAMWQTFGDELLEWHRPTRDHVWDACAASIRELVLTYLAAGQRVPPPDGLAHWASAEGLDDEARRPERWLAIAPGRLYYESLRMPSLVRIPMASVGTWSVRLDDVDSTGLHARHHFPQLRDPGMHDFALEGVDDEFLIARASVPDWLVWPRLGENNPSQLIRSDPTVASVWLVQERHRKPSYRGFLLSAGGLQAMQGPDIGTSWTLGVGYGFVDELLPLRSLPSMGRVSAEVFYQSNMGGGSRSIISPGMALQIDLPRFMNLHMDTGYAWGIEQPLTRTGMRVGIGVATETEAIGVTYAGLSLRARYQWLFLEEIVSGLVVEMVLH